MNGLRHLHPDDGRVYACPHCDNVPIFERQQDNVTFARGKAFVCYECHTGFDAPRERDAKQSPGPEAGAKGLAAKLVEMDPEEFPV